MSNNILDHSLIVIFWAIKKWAYRFIAILTIVQLSAKSVSKITHITSLSHINVSHLDKNTLVVFDVDDVLTTPNASTGMFSKNRNDYGKLIQEFQKKYPQYASDYEMYSSIIFKEQEELILDSNALKLLKILKNRNIKTIACTSWPSGSSGLIKNMSEHRYKVLKNLGITFNWSFENRIFYLKKQVALSKKNQKNNQPVFYKGIICTDGEKKGNALFIFLSYVKYLPKTIIFFDDSLKKIKNVQDMCVKHNINFYGYHYTRHLPTKWNEKLVRLKLEYLILKKKWFKNDEEALEFFNKKCEQVKHE